MLATVTCDAAAEAEKLRQLGLADSLRGVFTTWRLPNQLPKVTTPRRVVPQACMSRWR